MRISTPDKGFPWRSTTRPATVPGEADDVLDEPDDEEGEGVVLCPHPEGRTSRILSGMRRSHDHHRLFL